MARDSTEAVWYFADGDVERGPVTEMQIRTLIGTGNLTAEDLVWREGDLCLPQHAHDSAASFCDAASRVCKAFFPDIHRLSLAKIIFK
jgi:hypothetical protein